AGRLRHGGEDPAHPRRFSQRGGAAAARAHRLPAESRAQGARWMSAPAGRARAAWLLPVAALSSLLAGCRGGEQRALRFPHAPVILVSIDTLRSDHLPAYGYHGVET